MMNSTSEVSYKRTITSTQNYFEVSPLRKMKTAKPTEEKEEEKPVLIMKPFAAKPQISFVNVLINTEVTKFLYILNPDPVRITVEFVNVSPSDRHLQISALKLVVEAKSEAAVLLTWSPKEPGSWCDTITVKDSKGRRGAVSVSFVSIAPKQAKGVGRGVRRGVSQTVKPGTKPAVKPQWRDPQLPKPAPREAFKPALEKNTWTTFDDAVNKEKHTIPSTPFRRETYVLQERLKKPSENKENVASSTANMTAATSSMANTSCNSPAFTMQTRSMRKKSSTPIKPAAKGIAEAELEISRDSLDSSPVKPIKPKSKLLAMLETECVFSPLAKPVKPKSNLLAMLETECVFSPLVLSKKPQRTVEEDFLENTNLDDIDFMQGNIAGNDASFLSRRCSTTFKQLDKKPNVEMSPPLRVSPRELFSNPKERRLSSDTYVVSASNSLEGASGESILATTVASPGPSRLSRVAEVTELNEDFSVQLQDVQTQENLQLTVLTDDHISGVEFDASLAYAEFEKSEHHIPNMAAGVGVQTESTDAEEVHKSDTFEISSLGMQQEMAQDSMHMQNNTRETFDIVPPPRQQIQNTKVIEVRETFETHLQVEDNISEVFQNVHATFDISAAQNSEMSLLAKPQTVVDINNHTTFNISPPKQNVMEPQKTQDIKVKSTSFLVFSPPKPFRLPQVEWAASPEPKGTKNATYTKTKDCSAQDKTYNVLSTTTTSVFVPIGLTKPLVLETEEAKMTEEQNTSGEQLHDPDLFLYEYATLYASAPGMKKDPFYMNPMIHDAWLEKCDVEFKQWLNAVLTPPEELDAVEVTKVDAANLWARSTKAGANQELAPSREKVSSRYLAVGSRLDQLRRAALNLFRQPEIAEVLCKMTSRVDAGNIKMRQDKQLHLDQGLKQSMLALILSYNPLWLRLGLETVMGRIIPIQSNSDIHGLSHFIINRLLSVEAVIGKSHLILKAEYREKFNRFVLKKFLLLVFFLDQAKNRRLIRHNPCLFRRQSMTKTSKDMLLTLSRLLLAGEGDITKHLSYMGYTVSHKQGYLDEFYYSVTQLGVDLRDGVRLTRVVELVTGSSGLSSKLRVPPVSRLQKIHNVEVALKSLENAGYAVQNVKAVDIVAGHKEKTLSMLWQIVHNFQAPRIGKAARVIQNWWLHPTLKVQISRRIYRKQRDHAVITIQKYIRGYLCRKHFEELKLAAHIEKHHNAMACIIQKNWRIFLMTKRLRVLANWNKTNSACIIVQRNVRVYLAKKQLVTLKIQAKIKETARKEAAVVKIQALWRCVAAKKTLKQLKEEQKVKQLAAVVKIQTFIRCVAARKVLLQLKYEAKRTSSAVVLQSYWRQYLAKQILYNLKKCWEIHRQTSATQIQCAWRARVARKTLQHLRVERENQRQSAALMIQCLWRSFVAKKTLHRLQANYKEKQETAALKIQCAFRCFLAGKTLEQLKQIYETKKQASTTIQCAWRCFVARKVLVQLQQENDEKRNCAALKLQCSWRGFLARQTLQQLKLQYALERKSAITIQCAWRQFAAKKVLSRLLVENEEKRNSAALKIQCLWRCYVARQTLKQLQLKYKLEKNSATIVQCAWRCFQAKKVLYQLQAKNEEKKNQAALKIQCLWRRCVAKRTLLHLKAEHKAKNKAATVLQCAWRCFQAKKVLYQLQAENEEKKNQAALKIQCLWRCYVAKQTLLHLKAEHKAKNKAATVLQCAWRCFQAKNELAELKKQNEEKRNCAALKIQCLWRCYYAKEALNQLKIDFEIQRQAAITIQCVWRCFEAKKIFEELQKQNEQKKNYSALKIQCFWKCYVARQTLKQLKLKYKLEMKSATVIQCSWRTLIAKRTLLELRVENDKKRNCAALKIQCLWRSFIAQQTLFELKKNFETCTIAATTIQCAWRCFVARKVLVQRQQENDEKRNCAALKLQCSWRGFLARQILQQLKLQYALERKSAITIQCAWRQFEAKKVLSQLQVENKEKRNSAALKIQCLWRSYFARQTLKQLQAKFELKNKSVITIQCVWRCFQAKKTLSQLKQKYENKKNYAALKIQCLWRVFKARKSLKQLQLENETKRNTAALRIQCAWKCFQAKKVLTQLQEEHEEKRNNAALNIQCFWKCFVARQVLNELKNNFKIKNTAAIAIQCAWKQHLATKTLLQLKRNKEVQLNCAALNIQCWWRVLMSKKMLAVLKKEHQQRRLVAAVKIQAIWRMCCAKKVSVQLKKQAIHRQQCAAIAIQNKWRMYTAKKLLSRLKFEFETKKSMLLQEGRQQAAACVIQRAFRRCLWKRAVQYLMAEKQKVSKCVNEDILHAWEENLFTAGVFAPNTALSIWFQQKHMQQIKIDSATIIQAAWRGFACRRNNYRAAQAGKPVLIQAAEGEKPIIISAKLVTKVVEKQQRIQEAAKNANVENRIAYKIELALSQLGKTMGHDIYAMSIFDNYLSVTETCVPLILPALPYIANLLKTNNRSVPAMEAALPATGALLSLAKHPLSQPDIWEEYEELIPDLIYTLTITKDSNEKVFNNACTVLWMMARHPVLREEILKLDKITYRLKNLITHIQGRQRTTRQSARQAPPPLPSLRYNKNPRCFSARLHGLQTFMKLLGLPIPKSK